ncbi:MAG: hypothetical protein ACR2IE_17275 [Candidatus Sumerlaeaceae bacterium]
MADAAGAGAVPLRLLAGGSPDQPQRAAEFPNPLQWVSMAMLPILATLAMVGFGNVRKSMQSSGWQMLILIVLYAILSYFYYSREVRTLSTPGPAHPPQSRTPRHPQTASLLPAPRTWLVHVIPPILAILAVVGFGNVRKSMFESGGQMRIMLTLYLVATWFVYRNETPLSTASATANTPTADAPTPDIEAT